MKKVITIFTIALLATNLQSCRITKSLAVYTIRENSQLTEEQFLTLKENAVVILKLEKKQLEKCEIIWREEITKLKSVDVSENKNIAPLAYNSEVKFREILTTEQKENYKAFWDNSPAKFQQMFLNDRTMNELQRIYIL
jgi:hypothetical protein